MARPDNPALAEIEDDLADVTVVRAALRDLTAHWGKLDTNAAMVILEQAFNANQRMAERAKTRRAVFQRAYRDPNKQM